MPQASGLGSQLVLAKESTYGTRATPTKAFEYTSESFADDPSYQESGGLRAGRTMQPASRTKRTTTQAPGGFSLEVPTKGFGSILDLLHTEAVTPVQQGATAAYKQTHPIGIATTSTSKSATVQVNKPDNSGTDRPFDYVGATPTQIEFSLAVSGLLTAQIAMDAQKELTDQTLAVPTYPAGNDSFSFLDAQVVTYDGNPLASVSAASLQISRPMKTDRWFLGGGAYKAKPIANGFVDPTGTLTGEFESLSALSYFKSGAKAQLIISLVGAQIATGQFYSIKFTMPSVQLRGSSPQVGGPDVLEQSLPFKVLDDGTNTPLTIEYTSTDVSI